MTDSAHAQLKERFYTALDLTDEERDLADALSAEWAAVDEIARMRRESFLEHAQEIAEQFNRRVNSWAFARDLGFDPEKLAEPIVYERGSWERQ